MDVGQRGKAGLTLGTIQYIYIGYYTGSRSVRLDISTSDESNESDESLYFVSSCRLDKIQRRVKMYSSTELD